MRHVCSRFQWSVHVGLMAGCWFPLNQLIFLGQGGPARKLPFPCTTHRQRATLKGIGTLVPGHMRCLDQGTVRLAPAELPTKRWDGHLLREDTGLESSARPTPTQPDPPIPAPRPLPKWSVAVVTVRSREDPGHRGADSLEPILRR